MGSDALSTPHSFLHSHSRSHSPSPSPTIPTLMLTPNVVPDFTGLRVAVVGDVIVDHYLFTRPGRLSREAPVMVLRHSGEEVGPGGAANAARNLWSFGARTLLFGAVAKDSNGREILRLLEQEQVDVSGVVPIDDWVTPCKTRILGADPGRTMQQLLRIDREPDVSVRAEVRAAVANKLRSLAGSVDALLVSDYGYGLIGPEIARAAREVQDAGAVCVLDPRGDLDSFRGVTALMPNIAELARATGRRPGDLVTHAALAEAARELLYRLEPQWLLVTLGNAGMALFTRDEPQGITVRAAGELSVTDVSGAGDTVASAFLLALAAGLAGPRAMRLANAAAGVVVMEPGTVPCSLSRLRSALPNAPQPTQVSTPAVVRG